MRVHAVVTGRVQGVGFRYFVVEVARQLGLPGWVRNAGGGVEVVAEGERPRLEALVAQLELGPSAARVRNVQASYQPATGEYRGFEVRASG